MNRDGLAFLHAGERVLNRHETLVYNQRKTGNLILNINGVGRSEAQLMNVVGGAIRDFVRAS